MGAVRMRVRAELRGHLRSALSLVLLIGLGGGLVIASVAGARRTETVFGRLESATATADVIVGLEGPQAPNADDLARLPEVVAARPGRLYLMITGDADECSKVIDACVLAAAYGRPIGGRIEEPTLLRGRAPDQTNPAEAVVTVIGDEASTLEVGDSFELEAPPWGPPFDRFEQRVRARPLRMSVVGVVALPRDFPPQLGDETIHLQLTEAFFERYPESGFGIETAVALRLRNRGDLPALFERLGTTPGVAGGFDLVAHAGNVERSMNLQALALWLFAGLSGLALLLIVSQAIARDAWFSADDTAVLAALGMGRAALMATTLVRITLVAGAGALLAAGVAAGLSPLTPIGLARVAEPSPGFAMDPVALTLGTAAIIVLSAALAAPTAWRLARAPSGARNEAVRRPSATAAAAAHAGLGPAAVVGVRLALEPGRGRSAVPVRATIATITIGISALIAALSFGASLQRLLDEPHLYGVSWDALVGSEVADFSGSEDQIRAIDGVRDLAIGAAAEFGWSVGDEQVHLLAMDPGGIRPPLIEGRAPSGGADSGPVEAVVGTATLRRLRLAVGDPFVLEVPEFGVELEALVVGRGVIPTGDDSTAIGDGIWVSWAAVSTAAGIPADDEAARYDRVYLDLEPGVSAEQARLALVRRLDVPDQELWLPPVGSPADLVSFGRVRALPVAVAAVLALIALAALLHTLVTSINRRRGEIAILKSLGFDRGQVRRTIAVQATVIATLAVLIGIPLGLVGGRVAWTAFADSQGLIPAPVNSLAAAGIVLGSTLVLANLIAALPARAAARTRPAIVLRSE